MTLHRFGPLFGAASYGSFVVELPLESPMVRRVLEQKRAKSAQRYTSVDTDLIPHPVWPGLARFGPAFPGILSCHGSASGPIPNAAGHPNDVSMASQTPSNYYYYYYYCCCCCYYCFSCYCYCYCYCNCYCHLLVRTTYVLQLLLNGW